MTRTINATLQTDLAARTATATQLIELQFGAGTTRITTARQDILYSSQTWQAVGGDLQIAPVLEGPDMQAGGVDVKLSGVDQTLLALILNEPHRGRVAVLYHAHLNESTGALVGTPYELFRGYMNRAWEIDEGRPVEGQGTVTIKTRLGSRFTDFDQQRGVITSVASHNDMLRRAGVLTDGGEEDTFFQNVPRVVNVEVYWGRTGKNPATEPKPGGLFGGLVTRWRRGPT